MTASWNKTFTTQLLSNYSLQCLPNEFFQLRSEKCSGEKHSKIRITGLAAANAAGEKLTIFVIGKAKNPMCFENIQFYRVDIGGRKKGGWTVYY